MKESLCLRLKQDVQMKGSSEEELVLSHRQGSFQWDRPSLSLQKLVEALKLGATETSLLDGWADSLPLFFYQLERFKKNNLLDYSIQTEEGSPFLKLCGYSNCDSRVLEKPWVETQTFELSRFVYLHKEGDALLCKTPLAPLEIHFLHPMSVALLHALAKPKSFSALASAFPQLSSQVLRLSLFLLQACRCLSDADEDPSLTTWEFHDLLFHVQSRSLSFPEKVGGTFRFRDTLPPLPALQPPPKGEKIPLLIPEEGKDPSFFQVLEKRKSIRGSKNPPLSLKQLGAFLFHTARMKEFYPEGPYETTRRPYPGGGACYELEIYPLIHQCEGLEKGAYFYHPKEHALYPCSKWNEDCEYFFIHAMHAQVTTAISQILLLITARFRRVSWKYQSMAYATMLKNTGVLLQTMYLVATAMDLAPCAVGAGNSERFSKLLNKPFFEETTIGEFTLNS